MRALIGVAMLVAGCAGAFAQGAAPTGDPAPSLRRSPVVSPPSLPMQDGERLARQAAAEKRIAERNRRVIRSVCQGCGGAGDRPSHGRARHSRSDLRDEVPVSDPAQSPVD